MYALSGALAPAEIEADLPGHGGDRPVRFGNHAREPAQLQTLSAVGSPELVNTSNPGREEDKVPKN
jgi:hypothetical protein